MQLSYTDFLALIAHQAQTVQDTAKALPYQHAYVSPQDLATATLRLNELVNDFLCAIPQQVPANDKAEAPAKAVG